MMIISSCLSRSSTLSCDSSRSRASKAATAATKPLAASLRNLHRCMVSSRLGGVARLTQGGGDQCELAARVWTVGPAAITPAIPTRLVLAPAEPEPEAGCSPAASARLKFCTASFHSLACDSKAF